MISEIENITLSEKNFGHTVLVERPNDIIEAICSDDFTYEVEHLKENMEYLSEIANGKKLLILNTVAPYTQISPEARAFLANGPHKEASRAEAFVIHTLAHKMVASFFLKVNKPKVPTKFFTDRHEALKWLLTYKEQD